MTLYGSRKYLILTIIGDKDVIIATEDCRPEYIWSNWSVLGGLGLSIRALPAVHDVSMHVVTSFVSFGSMKR